MAQSEDTELRDLVVEALEKNGSLAKIRALLRANVFLAFENERDNIRHNKCLEDILKVPEGILSLSLIHEFLEFCNLKSTIFVYTAETQQGKGYSYEGRKNLTEKLLNRNDDKNVREPILVTLIKILAQHVHTDHLNANVLNPQKVFINGLKDDQNCTYIVHEDCSSVTSQSRSQSDNSSDEKNKLHLKLPLDNSDTDTSSDSTRDKSCSEYIPNKDILVDSDEDKKMHYILSPKDSSRIINQAAEENILNKDNNTDTYRDFNFLKENYTIPILQINNTVISMTEDQKIEDGKQTSSNFREHQENNNLLTDTYDLDNLSVKTPPELSAKSDSHTSYSYDFSSTPRSKRDEEENATPKSVDSLHIRSKENASPIDYSHSSVSISDITDLIDGSAKMSASLPKDTSPVNKSNMSKSVGIYEKLTELIPGNDKENNFQKKQESLRDSELFSESSVPSLSNLSLDFHSD